MADEAPPGSPWENFLLIFGGIAVLAVLWVAQGARGADLRGIFLHPPAPVGQGGAYGPQIGTTTRISEPPPQQSQPTLQDKSGYQYNYWTYA